MTNEIKEIDNSDLMELLETTSKKEFYRLTLDHELVVRLYNWITNLQEENEKNKEYIEFYKDMTDKWKDMSNVFKESSEDYKQRIDKAIEYIEKVPIISDSYFGEDMYLKDIHDCYYDDLLDILRGDE